MRLPLLIFLFVWAVSLKAQVNLVPNPSFEENDSCPDYFLHLYYALPWFQPFKYTGSNVTMSNSSDYFNSCTNYDNCDVPSNGAGYQEAKTGNAYAGIYIYNPDTGDYREYIETALSTPLIGGKKYHVEFYVSLADTFDTGCNKFGVYFSIDSALYENDFDTYFNVDAQVEDTTIITDKENWVLVAGDYIASGGEDHITIGNFNSNIETSSQFVGGGEHYPGSYYYIDDVSVTLDTTIGIAETEKPKLKIFPNPADNQITIEQLSVMGNQLSVEVYDAVGRLVNKSIAQGQQTTIPLNLSKGVYLLRVKEKEEVVFWEKLIIE